MLRFAPLLLAVLLACGCQNMGSGGAGLPFGGSRVPPPGTNSYPNPSIQYPTGSNPAAPGPVGFGAAPTGTAPVGTAPLGAAPAGTAPGGFNSPNRFTPPGTATSMNSPPASSWPASSSLFSERTPDANLGSSTLTPARFDSTASRKPGINFGDRSASTVQSGIRLNGMPVTDATKQPAPRVAANPAIPEITDLPPAYPAGYPPNYPPAYPPYYAPAATPQYNGSVYPPQFPPGYLAAPAAPTYAPGSIGNNTANSASTFGWKSKAPTGTSSGTSLR